MRKQVLFIQGGGEGAHAIDADLAASLARLLGGEFEVRFPFMPNEAAPEYINWKAAILEELRALDAEAFVIAHSVGGAVVVRLLAEAGPPKPLAGLFLVAAPYIGVGGWMIGGFEMPADLGARMPQTLAIYMYQGTNDQIVPFSHLDLYARVLPRAYPRLLRNRDHQLNGDLSEIAQDIRAMGVSLNA
jgi:predicted alpha/beta hydrolase family esterase